MIFVTKTHLPNIEKFNGYVEKIFDSGWITNKGKYVLELEERLKEYLGIKNIILVTNGTLALQIAYKILNLKGEVITTPFSFVATTSTLVWEGLNPVFVDIDKESLNIDTKKIEKAITKNTTAILPVHVFGNSCNIDEIDNIAKKYNLKVIYDAAHAFDVKYKKNNILNYGDISIISFHATKIFHTIEGGAIIVNDDALYEKAKKMINFGIDREDNIEHLGINAKMNEFQAVMGLCMLDEMSGIIDDRKKVYEYYINNLKQLKSLELSKINLESTPNYAYFPVVFESEEKMFKIKNELQKKNIYARRYFYPSLSNLPYLINKGVTPISDDISRRILCLPLYDSLNKDVQDDIINTIKQYQ